MSNFVHCMVCFVFPSEGVKFYLSSCGHIACVKCVQKGSMTLSCKVCLKDNPQILEINRNLKPELRELFTPLDDFSKIVHEIGQVLDFQDAQRQHLMRHLQTKNNTFDKMQEFCKEEMKKKTQYKEALMRAKVEYKKKCDEIQELKSKLNKMERCSSNLSDLTHDPFRTPMPPGHRSFTTSTPYNNPRHRVEDVTQSTTHGTTHQTDTSTSFSAAGIPLVPMDSGGEVAGLARMTSAMCRDSSSHIQQRSSTVFGSSDRFFQVSEVAAVDRDSVQYWRFLSEPILTGLDGDCIHGMEGDDDMTAVEAGTPPSADVLVEEPAADDEVVLPDGEEPTEEQVANAMRLSGSAEASPVKEDESTGSEESKSGQTSCAISSDIQDDFKCPTCGSTDDPSFMHCKKILKQTGTNFGAFVWRYRCARQACAKFFGDYYAYDKVSNSFVRLPEDADMVEQGKNEEEQRPEVPAVEDEDDDSDSAHSPPVAENIEPTAAEDTKAEDEPPSKEEPVEKTPHRSGRRARQTIRKSTAVVAKVKTPLSAEKKNQTPASLEKKKPEKTPISKVPKEAKSRVTPKRQPKKPVEAEKASSAPPAKKLPKGYVYEPVLDPQQQQQKVTEMIQKASIANGSMVPSSSECSTQTMCPAHVFSTLIDQLVNTQAESSVGSSLTTESPSTLPAHVARRLMISQQLIQRQSNELCRVQEENKRLYNIVALMNSVIRKFGDEYTPELRHLRDAIVVLKREFSFYQDEFVAEAKKSVVNIQAQKEEVQRKIDDVERRNRLLSARIDLHIKEREAADERADGFLRKISERDRDVILANKARDRAERKLKDSLYVANNAKCAHCQISDRMRAHLTDVVAEKTVLLEKSQKECQDLSRRADQSERISRILSKESEKLKFDLNTWKSDAERNLAEIARLKEELKRASAGHPMLNATTAMLQKPKADSQSPRQAASHSNSPAVPSSNEKPGTPRDSDPKGATTAQDERSNSTEAEVKPTSSGNRTSQGNPAARTPPEDPASPFSSWLGKERRVDVSPPRFFGSASSSRQAPHSASTRRSFPFNGPVFTDRPMSKDAAKNGEKRSQKSPRLTSDVARSVDIAGSSERVPPPHGRRHEGHVKPYPAASGERAMSWSPSVSDDFNANTKTATPRVFDAAPKWNGPAVVVDKQPLSGSRGESRKRKNWETDVVDKNPAARILPAVPPRPFNGPIALSPGGVASTSRPIREASPILDKERSEFSSSPLPWHQEGPPVDYVEWESSVTEYSPPSHTFERPMAQRQRKNFWEP